MRRLAIDVIREENILAGIDPSEQLLIEEAVRFHNLLEPPARIQSPTRRYISLIRDADKLDIWRVFVELLAQPPEERASAATLGLPDLPGQGHSGMLSPPWTRGSIIQPRHRQHASMISSCC